MQKNEWKTEPVSGPPRQGRRVQPGGGLGRKAGRIALRTLACALTLAGALVITVLLSKLIGALLPILARRLGMDPAVMASPLITTVVDTVSLLVYFRIAAALLGL